MLNDQTFRQLATLDRQPCVSIYTPTYRAGHNQEDRIRFKNALAEAEAQLLSSGLAANRIEATRFLAAGRDLLDEASFWLHLSDGLATFIAPDFFHQELVPIDFNPFVFVCDRFALRPIAPMLNRNERFFILALSQNEVRFFEGNRYSISPVVIGDLVPAGLEEALGGQLESGHLQMHSGQNAHDSAIYHGHGSGKDDRGEELRQYFRMVDEGLMKMLHDERPPLVLATADPLAPIYRQVSSYPHILDKHISGNPEQDDPVLLHEKAWDLLRQGRPDAPQTARAKFSGLMSADRASFSLDHILPAAYEGRIQNLLTDRNVRRWGAFNRQTLKITYHAERQTDSDDLLDLAAVQTYLHGGEVHNISREELPRTTADANALYRY